MNTKDVIINSARNLFSKYGYKKVSMDEIANDANVTKKTVYSYFKDKDSLFSYFIEEELELIKNNIEKERKKHNNVLDFVSSTVYNIIMHQKNSLLINNMFLESSEIESKTKKFLKLYEDEIIKYIESLILDEINLKHIRKCDAHLSAFIIYKTYVNVLFEYDKCIDAKEASKEIALILKDGLLEKNI
jgi:AcrR family transcriptional regulator